MHAKGFETLAKGLATAYTEKNRLINGFAVSPMGGVGMKRLLFAVMLIGLFLMGCTQLGNYGSPESPKAPPIIVTTPTPSVVPTVSACIKEGQTLGAVIPGNTAECCAGLGTYIPDGIVGTRGTCIAPENVPTSTPAAIPTESNSLANPASAHCVNLGYTETFQDEGTQCRFTDGSACDEWEFYRGKCGQSFSACTRNNGQLTEGSGRIGTAFFLFGLCTFADGSQCGEGELADGSCKKGQCQAWTARGCQN